MPTISASRIPPPKSWDEFEDIALSAAKLRWGSSDFYGRQGQRQDGVDIFGTDRQKRQIGVQGKNTTKGITEKVVKEEIGRAESFKPSLDALYIATTVSRDAPIQETVRLISEERVREGKCPVGILFWNDVCQDLALDDATFFKHYPHFRGAKPDPVGLHDRKLFDELLKLLSSDGVIGFVDRTNMAGFPFPLAALDPLHQFYHEWNSPEREFITPEIEEAKKTLREKVQEYLTAIAYKTFPTAQTGWNEVPADWEEDQPERFAQSVKQLHTLAGELVDLHGKLVRTARSHLIGGSKSAAQGQTTKPSVKSGSPGRRAPRTRA